MGRHVQYTQAREIEREDAEQLRLERMKVANKIIMVLVDEINRKIVRPGPVPEERECYDMAQELHDLKRQLADLVVRIIDVNGGIK